MTTTIECLESVSTFIENNDEIIENLEKIIGLKISVKNNRRNAILNKCFTMPLNLLNENVNFIKNNCDSYIVGDKADGVRFLLFVIDSKNYLISRNCKVYQLNTIILTPTDFNLSVLDGEFVINKQNIDNENRIGFYVAYDTLCYCGTPLLKYTNKSRYEHLYNFMCNKFSDLGFIIKTFYNIKHVDCILQNIIPNMPYKSDGLIFIKIDDPFMHGTNKNMFKWKRPEEHTVDFKVVHKNNNFYLYTSDQKDPFCVLKDIHDTNIVDNINTNKNTIVEFMYFNNNFIPLHIRNDKHIANSTNTVKSTLESVKQNISIEQIIKTFVK
tara:strand:+ start:350 stop:1327 length:978 start_codon:yes stop_codon:yes gene_type:complete